MVADADLDGAGFSEFETYGNYVAQAHPNSFHFRPLRTMRHGSKTFGPEPTPGVLVTLMAPGFDMVSFETWDEGTLTPRIVGWLWRLQTSCSRIVPQKAREIARLRAAAVLICGLR